MVEETDFTDEVNYTADELLKTDGMKTEETFTYSQVKDAVEGMGFDITVRQAAVDLAIKFFKDEELSVDMLVETAQKIEKYIKTGEVSP